MTNPNLHSKLVSNCVVTVELPVVVAVVAVLLAVVETELEPEVTAVVEALELTLDEAVELTVDTAHCESLPASYSTIASFMYLTSTLHSPL